MKRLSIVSVLLFSVVAISAQEQKPVKPQIIEQTVTVDTKTSTVEGTLTGASSVKLEKVNGRWIYVPSNPTKTPSLAADEKTAVTLLEDLNNLNKIPQIDQRLLSLGDQMRSVEQNAVKAGQSVTQVQGQISVLEKNLIDTRKGLGASEIRLKKLDETVAEEQQRLSDTVTATNALGDWRQNVVTPGIKTAKDKAEAADARAQKAAEVAGAALDGSNKAATVAIWAFGFSGVFGLILLGVIIAGAIVVWPLCWEEYRHRHPKQSKVTSTTNTTTTTQTNTGTGPTRP